MPIAILLGSFLIFLVKHFKSFWLGSQLARDFSLFFVYAVAFLLYVLLAFVGIFSFPLIFFIYFVFLVIFRQLALYVLGFFLFSFYCY